MDDLQVEELVVVQPSSQQVKNDAIISGVPVDGHGDGEEGTEAKTGRG